MDNLLNILESWSFWNTTPPEYIPRLVNLPKQLSPQLATIVQGVRRCGKSTLLVQFLNHYKLDKSKSVFVNFEDPRLADSLDYQLLEAVYTTFRSQVGTQENVYFFFDEIQNVHLWEKWIHAKIERSTKDYFILTGSNAALLAGELASSLTGRYQKIELYPFDFAEFKLARPDGTMEEFLSIGGFPLPVTLPEPYVLLREYFNDIVTKDIIARLDIRSSVDLRKLLKIVYESAGSELSYRKLSAIADLNVETIINYLKACESAYLLSSCPYFAYSEAKRSKRNKKYYPIDPGIRNAVVTTTGRDIGKSFETAVFIYLKKQYGEVSYWKEKNEVDFVVQNSQGILPIQVTYDETKERHVNALKEFYRTFPNAQEALHITRDNFESLAGV